MTVEHPVRQFSQEISRQIELLHHAEVFEESFRDRLEEVSVQVQGAQRVQVPEIPGLQGRQSSPLKVQPGRDAGAEVLGAGPSPEPRFGNLGAVADAGHPGDDGRHHRRRPVADARGPDPARRLAGKRLFVAPVVGVGHPDLDGPAAVARGEDVGRTGRVQDVRVGVPVVGHPLIAEDCVVQPVRVGDGGGARRQSLVHPDPADDRRRTRGRIVPVVCVELIVVAGRDPHRGPDRPEALRGFIVGVQREVFAGVPAPVRHAVGVQLGIPPVHHPHGVPVRPDADRKVVPQVQREILIGVPGHGRRVVGEQHVTAGVRHPHGGPVRPDAHRRAVGGVQREVSAGVPAPVRHPVGVQLVILEVRDPQGGLVRPDSGRIAVGGVQSEIAAGVPALALDFRGEKQGGEGNQSGKQQQERRKTPGRDHDLPPASQD